MQGLSREFRPEWMNDHRRSRRWVDRRTVLAGLEGEETLGKTCDLSVGGMRLEFRNFDPPVGRRLQMAVVLDDRVVDLGGTILYRERRGDGSSVGLEFDQPLEDLTASLLARCYPPAMMGAELGLPDSA